MTEASWQALDTALERLGESGQVARFWWRDDDAVVSTAALDRLAALSRTHHAAVLLAVIPAMAEQDLADRIAGEPLVVPAVHGYGHVNHAGPGEKKQELGSHRPVESVLEELGRGLGRLSTLFGDRLLPVLVPPWNRISPEVVCGLPDLGFVGVSVFGAEDKVAAPAGLRVVNTHVDPIDWHGSRSLVGPQGPLDLVIAHLERCADGRATGACGLLTHHLVHDEAVWAFVERLVATVAAHPSCRWDDPARLFPR